MKRVLILDMKRVLILASLVTLITLFSCRRNPYVVDLSGVKIDFEITRLEHDLFNTDSRPVRERVPELILKYGDFLQLFSYVINTGDVNSPSWHEYLSLFINDRVNYEAYGAVETVFPDIIDIEEDLRQAFRHYKYFFPERDIPSVYSCVTGFNNSIIIGDSVIGISLDRYLGPEAEFYGRLGI